MGNFRSKKKVIPAEPPPPLTTLEQILNNAEARERVTQAVAAWKPGVANRWQKILEITNRKTMPTEENLHPMNLDITRETLKDILITFFHEVKYISSDGLALARKAIPEIYDKHSLERGSRVSLKEREEKGIKGENFAYGELDHEIFATMYLKLVSVYGSKDGGKFYDLGCGVGTLVSYSKFPYDNIDYIYYIFRFIQLHLLELSIKLLGLNFFPRYWNEVKDGCSDGKQCQKTSQAAFVIVSWNG